MDYSKAITVTVNTRTKSSKVADALALLAVPFFIIEVWALIVAL